MTLETPRLRLRALEDSDAEALYLLARDPRVGPIAGWPPHRDLADSRRILHDILQTEESYAIVLKATGAVIGSIGLRRDSDLASGEGERELGYWLGVPFWGKGYMPEAAKEVLRHAFEDLKLQTQGRSACRRSWASRFNGRRSVCMLRRWTSTARGM